MESMTIGCLPQVYKVAFWEYSMLVLGVGEASNISMKGLVTNLLSASHCGFRSTAFVRKPPPSNASGIESRKVCQNNRTAFSSPDVQWPAV